MKRPSSIRALDAQLKAGTLSLYPYRVRHEVPSVILDFISPLQKVSAVSKTKIPLSKLQMTIPVSTPSSMPMTEDIDWLINTRPHDAASVAYNFFTKLVRLRNAFRIHPVGSAAIIFALPSNSGHVDSDLCQC